MASKWHQMTDEEKQAHMEKQKFYRYRKKAKELGITLEEYKARLEAKKKGATSKEAGLMSDMKPRKIDSTYRERVQKYAKDQNPEAADKKTAPKYINKGDHEVVVLFRKGDLLVTSFPNEKPVEGQKACMFFLNLDNMKAIPFIPEDYKPSEGVKNEKAVSWDRAEKILA